MIHPETWLASASERNLLDVYGIESSVVLSGPFVPYDLATAPPESSADSLSVLGVTHVVTTTGELAAYLAAVGALRDGLATGTDRDPPGRRAGGPARPGHARVH